MGVFRDLAVHIGSRNQLVKELIDMGIKDSKVIESMQKIPRHFFFDKDFENQAYTNQAFPIGAGQTISQPYTVAFQSELIEPEFGAKVLEVGTGSGYQAAILAQMGMKVFSVERHAVLLEKAALVLDFLKLPVALFQGDGSMGLKDQAPFQKILVTAGSPDIPNTLLEQLDYNGILVLPVGNEKTQTMLRIRKNAHGNISTEKYSNFTFVPLIGKEGWQTAH